MCAFKFSFPGKLLQNNRNVGDLLGHMGAEVQNSFKEVPRGDQYGKLTMRNHGLRKYVSPNQTCLFFLENVIFSAQGPPGKDVKVKKGGVHFLHFY